MRKINLKAKNLPSGQDNKNQFKGSSLTVGIILLILATGLYGGVFYLKSSQDKKVAIVKKDIQLLKNDLDKNKDYKELYNFQDRLLEIKRLFKNKVIQANVLTQISEVTMNENVIQWLKITMDDGASTVDMSLQTADLNILAKQINAYSQVDANKQATLNSSSLGEEGVEASLTFSINASDNTADKKIINK